MNIFNTIKIKNLKGEVIFTHTAEDNTVLNTLKSAVRNGVSLRYAIFRWADLAGADLSGIDLRDTDLTGADLTFADLTDTNLTRANLVGAKYTQEQIDLAITDDTTIF